MTSPIADMVHQMLASDVPHDMITLAVATVERAVAAAGAPSTTMATMPTGRRVDTKQEKRRLSERRKKAKWRAKRENSPPASNGGQVDPCAVPNVDMVDTSTSAPLSLFLLLPRKKEPEGERRVRTRPSPVDIPADWRPSPEDERFAADPGFSPAEIADVAFKFKNHFSASRERRWDWSKAWLNWVIDERRPAPRSSRRQSRRRRPSKGSATIHRRRVAPEVCTRGRQVLARKTLGPGTRPARLSHPGTTAA
jgi:hypothetical protein